MAEPSSKAGDRSLQQERASKLPGSFSPAGWKPALRSGHPERDSYGAHTLPTLSFTSGTSGWVVSSVISPLPSLVPSGFREISTHCRGLGLGVFQETVSSGQLEVALTMVNARSV